MDTIITRFPPSPTGYLHLGGARTALFNWLYARKMNGKFVLRIEDTDTARSTQESVDAIFDSLEWLGIDWDEGPFFQSKRIDIHNEHIQKLIDSGDAYYCTCTPEEVDAMRKKAQEQGMNPMYDRTCREKGLGPSENAVVRFKAPLSGTTVLPDQVKKSIAFQNTEIDDFIIQRGDGSPMYNLAVVVDDITMGINTIIRGDDHVMNTPKQMLLYKALGAELPVYAHVPMVLGPDKARLSKRHGAMSVSEYREMGFLPDAMLNYLVRLGWSCGDQEFFTRNELIEKFTLENIGRSPGVFDTDKLTALNANHIQAAAPSVILPPLTPLLSARGITGLTEDHLAKAVQTLATRSKTLVEMADDALFYFTDEITYDEKAAKKFLKEAALVPVSELVKELTALSEFTEAKLEDAFKAVMETTELKLGKIAQPVRVALTGRTNSPGIFEVIEVLGREKTLKRLTDAVAFIEEKVKQG